MAQANLLISFWRDAFLIVAYIFNRVPSKFVSSTPYELWNGEKPNLGNLHPWGVQFMFTIILINIGNLVIEERSVSL